MPSPRSSPAQRKSSNHPRSAVSPPTSPTSTPTSPTRAPTTPNGHHHTTRSTTPSRWHRSSRTSPSQPTSSSTRVVPVFRTSVRLGESGVISRQVMEIVLRTLRTAVLLMRWCGSSLLVRAMGDVDRMLMVLLRRRQVFGGMSMRRRVLSMPIHPLSQLGRLFMLLVYRINVIDYTS